MSAETLRRAADAIRHDLAFGQERGEAEFVAAVADWLDMFAAVNEAGHSIAFDGQALSVARAYLGGDDD